MKVIKIDDAIIFDDGTKLDSYHDRDCSEHHYLGLDDLKLEDFDGLEFDLSKDNFFERVEDYGIRLLPTNGHPVSIPGYGSNNGYYSTNLILVLSGTINKRYDITECQKISD